MKKRMKKVATLCLAGVTAMSTVGVTGSAVFAKGDTNYDVDNMDFENVELRVAFRFNNGSDTILRAVSGMERGSSGFCMGDNTV